MPRGPDPAEHRRNIEQQRRQRLEEARLQGPEAYADIRDQFLREDFAADSAARTNHLFEQQDRRDFRDAVRDFPALRQVSDEVERRIQAARQQGNFALTREMVGKYLLGERLLTDAPKARQEQQRRADQSRRRETVRAPGSSRSDTGSGARRAPANSQEALRRRLANQDI